MAKDEQTGSVQSPEQDEQAPTVDSQDAYEELNNRYLRLAADFDNFRKRQAQEREFLFKYGAQNTLETLLPVLDNLTRAHQSLSESSEPALLYKSFALMNQQLQDTLKAVGLEKMTPVGEPFSPELHEAVSQVENPDKPDHTVVEVYQDGYRLHDRVLRPAQVVVSVHPAFQSVSSENNPFQQPLDA